MIGTVIFVRHDDLSKFVSVACTLKKNSSNNIGVGFLHATRLITYLQTLQTHK